MRVVHKFKLPAPTSVIEMDPTGIVRRVGAQGDDLFVWAEVDPNAKKEPRVFHVYGTGFPVVDGDEYLGTAVMKGALGSELVWHAYERRN
jgi:hypothetical protein